MQSIKRTLVVKLKAGYPALYIQTSEDVRTIAEIEEAAKLTDRKVYVWTLEKGLKMKTAKGEGTISDTGNPDQVLDQALKLDQKSVVVLRHYHHFLPAPAIQSRLIDLIGLFKATKRHLIIVTPVRAIPPELEKDFTLIEMPLPLKDDLLHIVDGIASNLTPPTSEVREKLAEAARGLTVTEAENAIAESAIEPNLDDDMKPKDKSNIVWSPDAVLDAKCETVKRSQMLTYHPVKSTVLDEIGGLHLFKKWIDRRAAIFKNWDAAMEFGCDIPKGVLMIGVPGTGKSLGAHATAAAFGLPLIRVDMGAIFGGLVGESEANARAVIRFLEAVAPCVGWLDEIEKGFAGAQGGQLDSGVGARVLGTFLTWMNDKTSPVFIYATANNVQALPPELLRKGRFDEMFYVALPNAQEREEIFRIHVSKRKRSKLIENGKLDIKQLALMTQGYSGAEIEAVVREALDEAFTVQKDLNMFDIQEAMANVVPLEKIMKEEIQAIQRWATGRTRPANMPEEFQGTAGGPRQISV